MTDRQKILDEIKRLKHYGTIPYDMDALKGIYMIETFVKSLPSEQPSEGLEEAATALTNEIVGELNAGDYTDHSGHNAHWHSFKEGVVAGANWQKEQTINKACGWLNKNVVEYHPRTGKLRPVVNINAFREAMEK